MTMSDLERNRALREYRDMIEMGGKAVIRFSEDPVAQVEAVKKKARRKKSAYSKRLSKELKDVRKQATTKAGRLRKGMTPAKIMAKAHKRTKRYFK